MSTAAPNTAPRSAIDIFHAPPSWLAEELTQDFLSVLKSIPPAPLLPPYIGEAFLSRAAQQRFRDKAFSDGFAVVNGRHSSRIAFELVCSHHGHKTQNTRKTDPGERERPRTHLSQMGCPWKVRGTCRDDKWSTTTLIDNHNHPAASDPFTDVNNRGYHPSKNETLKQATLLRKSRVTHSQAQAVLAESGLHIGKKEYYNTVRTHLRDKKGCCWGSRGSTSSRAGTKTSFKASSRRAQKAREKATTARSKGEREERTMCAG
jgi:hypothetical protein